MSEKTASVLTKFQLYVNGDMHTVTVDVDTPLLWVLRDHLGLMGTKYSCGIGECGACTVLVDSEPTQSCITTVDEVQGKQITTIEGLDSPMGKRVKTAWEKEQVPQCGFCQPGQIITAANLLEQTPSPTDDDIDSAMDGMLCRCGTYPAIRRAIHRAAKD